jgi:hypothetical protein
MILPWGFIVAESAWVPLVAIETLKLDVSLIMLAAERWVQHASVRVYLSARRIQPRLALVPAHRSVAGRQVVLRQDKFLWS